MTPAIPLLDIHTEETRSEIDTCTPMFIAALFIMSFLYKLGGGHIVTSNHWGISKVRHRKQVIEFKMEPDWIFQTKSLV